MIGIHEFARFVHVIALASVTGLASSTVAKALDQVAQPGADAASRKITTGFSISADQIMTTAHGVDGCASVSVIPNNSGPVKAERVQVDREIDLALISVRLPQQLPPLSLHDTARPATGEHVFMLGFPLQWPLRVRLHSFYEAVVSGPSGIGGDSQVFRLGVIVPPGMSGAALLDSKGRVIGMIKSHIIETAPNNGPTLGGQTFAISGEVLAGFLRSRGLKAEPSTTDASLTPQEIALRAIGSSVAILCSQ